MSPEAKGSGRSQITSSTHVEYVEKYYGCNGSRTLSNAEFLATKKDEPICHYALSETEGMERKGLISHRGLLACSLKDD